MLTSARQKQRWDLSSNIQITALHFDLQNLFLVHQLNEAECERSAWFGHSNNNSESTTRAFKCRRLNIKTLFWISALLWTRPKTPTVAELLKCLMWKAMNEPHVNKKQCIKQLFGKNRHDIKTTEKTKLFTHFSGEDSRRPSSSSSCDELWGDI